MAKNILVCENMADCTRIGGEIESMSIGNGVQSREIFGIRDIDFGYGGKNQLFTGLTCQVWEGEFILIGGPSGSGKTSFFKLLNRLQEPNRGSISFRGRSISEYDPVMLRQQVSYVSQIPVMAGVQTCLPLWLPKPVSARSPGQSNLHDGKHQALRR